MSVLREYSLTNDPADNVNERALNSNTMSVATLTVKVGPAGVAGRTLSANQRNPLRTNEDFPRFYSSQVPCTRRECWKKLDDVFRLLVLGNVATLLHSAVGRRHRVSVVSDCSGEACVRFQTACVVCRLEE